MAISFDFDRGSPLTEQIERRLRLSIEEGALHPGSRLPSVRQLARQCGVSVPTVVEAYNRLVAVGRVEARRGSGYYVSRRGAEAPAFLRRMPADLPIDSMWLSRHVFEEVNFEIEAGSGWLPENWLYEEGMKAGLRSLARAPSAQLMRYGTPHGYLPLRQLIQTHLQARGIDAQAQQIVLTHGASEALSLLVRLLVKEGDTVLIDDPGYCNLISLLKQEGAQTIGVPRTASGPDVQAFGTLVAAHRPRAFFTNTSLQNPTGTDCSPATAHQLLQIASQAGLHIVEDDIFGGLHSSPAPTLAALDRLRSVVHVQSFSKTISPALRVGFLACPQDMVDEVVHLKMLSALTTSEIAERLVFSILTDGHYRHHLESLRDRLMRYQAEVCHGLENAGMQLFHKPASGMFVWAGFKGAAAPGDVVSRAARQGIMLAPGSLFRVDGSEAPWFRFNVAHCNRPALFRLVEDIAREIA